MKLLLLILALTVYQITPAAIGGYNLVDPSELNQDKNIQDILSFGARYVIEQGIQAQDLPDFDYEVTAVYSVYRQVVSGLNYMFDVEIRGAEGTIIRSSYIVYDQAWTNTRKVTSYNYDIEETGETGNENLEFLPDEVYWSEEENNEGFIAGGWTQHDLSEVENDPEIQALLNYGVQDLTQQEVLAQQLPNAQYTVSQIHSVWSQVVSGMNYRFDVDITNDLGWVLRATFVVYSQPWTGTQDVTSYAYAVTTNPNPSEEEEFVIPEEDLPGGYQPIDPSKVDTDEQLKNALGAGVRDVVGQAVINHHLPESRYDVDQIHSIYGQVVSGMNYRFDVDLINCAGLVARVVFTVYSQSWTHTLDTTLDRLEITSIPDEGLIGGDCPQGDNGDDGNEEATPGETEWETEWGETGPIVGGYTPADLHEAENDPIIQELLDFGAQFVATEGINGHRLPDSEYQVNKVYSVQEQVVAGMNYQFDVELVNCHGLTVRANYVVYYISWQGTKQVRAFRFDITGAPNGFFIGGCPNEGEEESTIEEEGEGTIVGDFSPVDLQDAEKDQQLQDALTFGVQELAKRAIADGELPDNSYSLDSLNSVEQQVVSGMNYRFDANLLSGDGTSVRATFEVYSQPWTNTQKLTSYSILAVGPANEGSP